MKIFDDTEIIENFLPEDVFKNYEDAAFGTELPWHRAANTGHPEATDGMYFFHTIYDKEQQLSELYSHVAQDVVPLLPNFNKLVRSRINLYPKTHELHYHALHTDYDYPVHGAVLSLNTCDGYTQIGQKARIKSIRNRVLFHPSHHSHGSTTCTDQDCRVVLVFNWT